MSEIFDIISAINHLRDQFTDFKKQFSELNKRIDFICKNPSLISFDRHVGEETACKLLHISQRQLLKMRINGEIAFTKHHRRILYPVASIRRFLGKHTVPAKPSL